MPVVYILRCADGAYYVGKTSDLVTRLTEHQAGVAAAFTASRRPVEMVYAEEHSTSGSASDHRRAGGAEAGLADRARGDSGC